MNRPASTLSGTVIALSAAFFITLAILLFAGGDPGQSIYYFFYGPFMNTYWFGNLLSMTGLLILGGTGMAVAFRAGTFNLGGEGQVYAGAMAATTLSYAISSFPRLIAIPLLIGAAAGAGGVIASVSGYLKMKWNTDELISSFLLSGGVVHFVDYLINGPFRNMESFLLSTHPVPGHLRLTPWLPPSSLTISLLTALCTAGAFWFILFKGTWGYQLRLCGLNREFARYGGIRTDRFFTAPMAISGALYGAAGGFAVLGIHHMAIQGFTSGMGWNGIAVALIARNHPLYVIPAALIFAFLETGVNAVNLHTAFSLELSSLIQAALFFLITARIVTGRRKLP